VVSTVIPTWNEARWLPRLLAQLRDLNADGQIVVADNSSDDGTRDLALAAGCVVVDGGRPAAARNAGARFALDDVLLFLDADAVLPTGFFDRIDVLFRDPTTTAVHCPLVPASSQLRVRLAYAVVRAYIGTLDRVGCAQGVGPMVAVRRGAFEAVGGFDETLAAGEDTDFLRRVGTLSGRVVFDRRTRVGASARRFALEPPTWFIAKTVLWAVLRIVGSHRSVVGYTWRRYPDDLADRDVAALNALENAFRARNQMSLLDEPD
jgi:glycosyltransferase involved in cell wall biosynthesis